MPSPFGGQSALDLFLTSQANPQQAAALPMFSPAAAPQPELPMFAPQPAAPAMPAPAPAPAPMPDAAAAGLSPQGGNTDLGLMQLAAALPQFGAGLGRSIDVLSDERTKTAVAPADDAVDAFLDAIGRR